MEKVYPLQGFPKKRRQFLKITNFPIYSVRRKAKMSISNILAIGRLLLETLYLVYPSPKSCLGCANELRPLTCYIQNWCWKIPLQLYKRFVAVLLSITIFFNNPASAVFSAAFFSAILSPFFIITFAFQNPASSVPMEERRTGLLHPVYVVVAGNKQLHCFD